MLWDDFRPTLINDISSDCPVQPNTEGSLPALPFSDVGNHKYRQICRPVKWIAYPSMNQQISTTKGREIVAITYLVCSLAATTVLTGYNDSLRAQSQDRSSAYVQVTRLQMMKVEARLDDFP